MIDLRAAPFCLGDEDLAWVERTLSSMTGEEKLGQLFCFTEATTDEAVLTRLIETYRPGAFMYRCGPGAEIQRAQRAMQKASRIPLLLAANLESGGNGAAAEGTYFGKPMQVAAAQGTEQARRLGEVCGSEGAAVGCNWAFAPIVDIDRNWRNPITNVRTFGADPARVLELSAAYMDGLAPFGLAPCIKHFPGDGVDERDQHLLPSVNSLTGEQWRATYGMVYQALIDKGALTLMAGHILQPSLTRELCPGIADEDILPASTNTHLLTGLLRGQMHYNGLITTDATPMTGYSAMRRRAECLPLSIAAGCDMLLFCKDIDEDFASLRAGIESGLLTWRRVDEAVTRILAAKAALGLHRRQAQGTLVPGPEALECLGSPAHTAWAQECADGTVTLVKDNQHLLPISPRKTPRVRLTVLGEGGQGFGDNVSVKALLKSELEKAGFQVALYDYETLEQGEIFTSGVAQLKEKFDLSLVAANVGTASNNTTRRLDWVTLMAADEPWYVRDIPTLFVSFANPYHLADVPFVSTFINCYSANACSVRAFVQKAMGRSPFRGQSPVDPFCGMYGADFM